MNRRTILCLLAGIGLVGIGVAVYAIFFAQPTYIEGRPTAIYFHTGR